MAFSYHIRRTIIYSTMFIGYFLYYLNRKSFAFLMPYVMQEEGMSRSQLGAITSSISLAYTISKFINGMLSDRVSARALFSAGLLLVSLLVIQFTTMKSINMFMLLWFMNGLAQGGGWPACSKLLKQWFLPTELGLWWSVLSTSVNLAGILGPIGLAFIASEYGWRYAMHAAGILGLVWAGVSFLMIKNSPKAVGLKPLAPSKNASNGTDGVSRMQSSATTRDIITSPFLWVVSILFFIVGHSSTVIVDWGQLYLIQEIGFPKAVGSAFLSFYSFGAIVGSISSGYVTDRLVAMASKDTRGSPRFRWFLYTGVIHVVFIHIFRTQVSLETSQMSIIAIGLVLGFVQYSAYAVYGVVAIESAPIHLSGTSHAFAAMTANVGVLMAGFPLAYVAEHYNWHVILVYIEALTSD